MNRTPPGPCFVYSLIVAILAIAFAGFGLACWQNPEFRAGVWNLCLTCGIGFVLAFLAVLVMAGRTK